MVEKRERNTLQYLKTLYNKLDNVFFNKKWFWICAINITLLVICVILKTPLNETNDDTGMRALASGAYGDNNGYLVFINVILGKFISMLYSMIPSINWYSWTQIAIVLLAFSMIGNLLFDRLGISKGLLVYAILTRLFFAEFMLVLQFTRVAILIGIIGYLYIIYGIKGEVNKFYVVLGFFATTLSLLLRKQGFFAVSIFGALIAVFELVMIKDFLQHIKKYMLYGTIFISIFGAAYFADYYVYNYASEEWSYYNEFNIARSKLVDYGFPNYEENKEAYTELGVSQNDFMLYSKSMLLYDDTLDNDTLQKLVELKEQEDKGFTFQELKTNIMTRIIKNIYIYIFLVISIIFIYINTSKKYRLLYSSNVFVYIALYMYFMVRGRLVDRVFLPITFAFILVSLFCFQNEKMKKIEVSMKQTLAVLAVAFLLFGTKYKDSYEKLINWKIDAWELYSETVTDKSKVYFADLSVSRRNYLYFDAMQDFPKGYFENQVHTGGWVSRMPNVMEQKEKRGISNLSTLIEQEQTYLYTLNNEELFKVFLEEHYYAENTISYSIVDNANQYKIISYCQNFIDVQKTDTMEIQLENIAYSSFAGYYKITMHIDTELEQEKLYLEVKDEEKETLHTYKANENNTIQKENKIVAVFLVPVADFENVKSEGTTMLDFSHYTFDIILYDGIEYYR